MSTTANTIITNAYNMVGLIDPEETPSAAMAQSGLYWLNLMLGSWSLQDLTKPFNNREVFALTANKGGPSLPYTIGPGGDFNTTRPASLTGAGLILGSSSPLIEMPRALLTDDAWQQIQVKDLSNALFTDVYYNPTFAGGLGTINLWPVPNTAANSLVIYRDQQLALTMTLTSTYELPEGSDEPITTNLAMRLAMAWQVPVSNDLRLLASTSLGVFKRSNLKLTDLPTDPALTADNRYGYNIQTGTGGQ